MLKSRFFFPVATILIILLLVGISWAVLKINSSTDQNQLNSPTSSLNQKTQEEFKNLTDQTRSAFDELIQNNRNTDMLNNLQDNTLVNLPKITSSEIKPIVGTKDYEISNLNKLSSYKKHTLQTDLTVYEIPKKQIDESLLVNFDQTQLLNGKDENKKVGDAIMLYNTSKQKLQYTGHGIDFLYDFKINDIVYWFYGINEYGSVALYVSYPYFNNAKYISGYTELDFIESVTKTSKEGQFYLYARNGNGVGDVLKLTVDISRSFLDPNQKIVIKTETESKYTPPNPDNTQPQNPDIPITPVTTLISDKDILLKPSLLNQYRSNILSDGTQILNVPKSDIYKPYFDEIKQEYPSSFDFEYVDKAVFIVTNDNQVLYAGHSIEFIYDFTLSDQNYWFVGVYNIPDNTNFYLGKPNFKDLKKLKFNEEGYNLDVTPLQNPGQYQIKLIEIIGETYEYIQYTVDVSRAINDPNADIVLSSQEIPSDKRIQI